MNLSIKVINDKPKKIWNVMSAEGQLQINDFQENFVMPLDWWLLKDYERQWKEGLERLKDHDQSCLISTIYDPNIKPWIEWFVLYKVNDHVHVSPMALYGDIYKEEVGTKPFTVENCYTFIPPHDENICQEDGDSEWVVKEMV